MNCAWPFHSILVRKSRIIFWARCCFRNSKPSAAEKEFREALRLNASADNHYALAACLISMDRNEEALAELDSAARLDPERALYRARREELLKVMKETKTQ